MSCSGFVGDLIFMVAIVGVTFEALLQGYLGSRGAAVLLFGLVAVRASARLYGDDVSHYVRLTCRLGIPIASVLLVVLDHTNPASVVVILGTYAVFWLGFAPILVRNRHWGWMLLSLSATFIWLFYLAGNGYIPGDLFFLAFMILLIAGVFARQTDSDLVRSVLELSGPIASLIVLAGIMGQGNWQAIGTAMSGALVMLVILIGFYVMLGAPFRRRRDE